jgi:DNA-binding NtrC family response regulator
VGEDSPVKIDVRILAATHRDLRQLVEAGAFREDLYYRLKVVTLQIPALREHKEDIPVLARHFFATYAERFGAGPLRIPDTLMERLISYDWPGNVRELENAIESLVALSVGGELDVSLLPGLRPAPSELTLKQRVDAYERGIVVEALEAARGNRSEAARRLGISRVTLHDKLKKYGLSDSETL